MEQNDDDLPDVHFGNVGSKPVDWRKAESEDDDLDDEVLAETPSDVVAMLGFDPLDDDGEDAERQRATPFADSRWEGGAAGAQVREPFC